MNISGLIQMIRREAHYVYQAFALPTTFLSVTGYNPQDHTVKGTLHPHGIESGWLAIATPHASANAGFAIGPIVGSDTEHDGDQFLVSFMGNDPNNPIVTNRLYSKKDPPPLVQSGEVIMQHKSGTHVLMDQNNQLTIMHGPSGNTIVMASDNSITVTHKPTGSSFEIDASGNHVHDLANKAGMTIKNHTGLTVQGNLSITGQATLNGNPIATS